MTEIASKCRNLRLFSDQSIVSTVKLMANPEILFASVKCDNAKPRDQQLVYSSQERELIRDTFNCHLISNRISPD